MVQLHFGVKQLNISKTMGVLQQNYGCLQQNYGCFTAKLWVFYSKTMGVYIHFCGTMYSVLTWRVFAETVMIILRLPYDTGLIIAINMQ